MKYDEEFDLDALKAALERCTQNIERLQKALENTEKNYDRAALQTGVSQELETKAELMFYIKKIEREQK
jgi:hypothetical protein